MKKLDLKELMIMPADERNDYIADNFKGDFDICTYYDGSIMFDSVMKIFKQSDIYEIIDYRDKCVVLQDDQAYVIEENIITTRKVILGSYRFETLRYATEEEFLQAKKDREELDEYMDKVMADIPKKTNGPRF